MAVDEMAKTRIPALYASVQKVGSSSGKPGLSGGGSAVRESWLELLREALKYNAAADELADAVVRAGLHVEKIPDKSSRRLAVIPHMTGSTTSMSFRVATGRLPMQAYRFVEFPLNCRVEVLDLMDVVAGGPLSMTDLAADPHGSYQMAIEGRLWSPWRLVSYVRAKMMDVVEGPLARMCSFVSKDSAEFRFVRDMSHAVGMWSGSDCDEYERWLRELEGLCMALRAGFLSAVADPAQRGQVENAAGMLRKHVEERVSEVNVVPMSRERLRRAYRAPRTWAVSAGYSRFGGTEALVARRVSLLSGRLAHADVRVMSPAEAESVAASLDVRRELSTGVFVRSLFDGADLPAEG